MKNSNSAKVEKPWEKKKVYLEAFNWVQSHIQFRWSQHHIALGSLRSSERLLLGEPCLKCVIQGLERDEEPLTAQVQLRGQPAVTSFPCPLPTYT